MAVFPNLYEEEKKDTIRLILFQSYAIPLDVLVPLLISFLVEQQFIRVYCNCVNLENLGGDTSAIRESYHPVLHTFKYLSGLNTLDIHNKRCFDSRFLGQILTVNRLKRIKVLLREVLCV